MNVEELIAEKQRIASDTTLDPETRKKKLRQLRKQIRSGGGSSRPERDPSEETPRASTRKAQRAAQTPQAIYTREEFEGLLRTASEELGLHEMSSHAEAGYAFSVKAAVEAGVEPSVVFNKFKQRWNREPEQFAFIVHPLDTLFLLGPVPK